MSERAMRLRIGIFVLLAMVLMGVLITLFSSAPSFFRRHSQYTVLLPEAPGVASGTGVRRSGVRIGEVKDVDLDAETGQVRVRIVIDRKHPLRHSEQAVLTHGLFGDTTLDIVQRPRSAEAEDHSPIEPGTEVAGVVQPDARTLVSRASEAAPAAEQALEAIAKLVQRLDRMSPPLDATLREFGELARRMRATLPDAPLNTKQMDLATENWSKVGARLESILSKNEEKLGKTLDNLNDTLTGIRGSFSDENQRNLGATLKNMSSATDRLNNALSEENQRNLGATFKNLAAASEAMPSALKNADGLFKESRQTLRRMDDSLTEANKLLLNLQQAARPLAENGERYFQNLDGATDKLCRVLTEMEGLLQVINHGDGTLQRLLSDPSLYHHMNEIGCFVTSLLPRIDCMMRDAQIMIDKLARHPELLGAGGIVRPSNGVKEAPRTVIYTRPPGQ